MKILRQSTAVTIVLGPFVDNADGYTPETGLTITRAEVRISKNAAAFGQKNESSSLTAMETNGYYSCALDTTDTNTLGQIIIAVNETGALPVWDQYNVVPAMVYDALIAGTDVMTADVTQFDGLATATQAAILKLKQIDVLNSAGDAVKFISTNSDGKGMNVKGHMGGASFEATAGNYSGLQTIGFGTGSGQRNTAPGTGSGVLNWSTGGGHGTHNRSSSGSGSALYNDATGATGPGQINIGGTSSPGQKNQGGITAGIGLENVGTGAEGQKNLGDTTKAGMWNQGGASGVGVKNVGNASYGMENDGTLGVYNHGSVGGQKNEATAGSYPGLQNLGIGSAPGQKNLGGTTGEGLLNEGGATYGAGQRNVATGLSYAGVQNVGAGSGAGQLNYAGSTGHGLENTGGSIQGHGQKNSGGLDGIGLYNFGTGANQGQLNQGGATNGEGMRNEGGGSTSHGQINAGHGTGRDLYAKEVGNTFDLDGLSTLGVLDVLKKFADDNGGADYDATTDSLHKIAISGAGLTAQQARDAMKLAPTAGAPAAGSVDAHLDSILSDIAVVDSNVDSIGLDLATVDTNVDALAIALATVDVNVDSIVAKLPSGLISNLKLTDTVDGVTLDLILQRVMAMADGRFRKDFPAAGDVTFYKRDNVTVLTTVNVTTTERTRS